MTNGERLAVLETGVELVNKQITEMRVDIKTLSVKIDELLTTKVTDHGVFNAEIEALKKDVRELKRKNNLWSWLSPTLSAIVSSIVTFLVLSYLGQVR